LRDEAFIGKHHADVPAFAERAAQFVGVPTRSRAENDRSHLVH
jgi:hypothetical protein